ncbi:MAG: c-type cytochrome [Bryobacteraceae bacterium]
MRHLLSFIGGAIALVAVVCLIGLIFLKTGAHGFSANAKPSGIEKWAAIQARDMAVPSDAKSRNNPVPDSPDVIAAGRAHWADHCAVCHGNDGKGQTEMGEHMYPPAPNMTRPATQNMTDGQIFYIIQNGIRLSGMPAWGSEHTGEEDSWKLVRLIRHLPSLTEQEIQEMEKLNPKGPEEWEEQQQEEQFLNGEPSNNKPDAHHHH